MLTHSRIADSHFLPRTKLHKLRAARTTTKKKVKRHFLFCQRRGRVVFNKTCKTHQYFQACCAHTPSTLILLRIIPHTRAVAQSFVLCCALAEVPQSTVRKVAHPAQGYIHQFARTPRWHLLRRVLVLALCALLFDTASLY